MRPLPETRLQALEPDSTPEGRSLDGLDDPTLLALMLTRGPSCTDPHGVAADLFARFGSLAAITAADLPELARIEGVGPVALTDLSSCGCCANAWPVATPPANP